ncbi:hypothetical protein FQR65_LT20609 [Abscondita terminalis]|nr:hypothetical protein FQR65_LT20609 [Abscondita terminalis]
MTARLADPSSPCYAGSGGYTPRCLVEHGHGCGTVTRIPQVSPRVREAYLGTKETQAIEPCQTLLAVHDVQSLWHQPQALFGASHGKSQPGEGVHPHGPQRAWGAPPWCRPSWACGPVRAGNIYHAAGVPIHGLDQPTR